MHGLFSIWRASLESNWRNASFRLRLQLDNIPNIIDIYKIMHANIATDKTNKQNKQNY